MYTPESLRPPPLVDPEEMGYGNPPFIPAPQGVTNGGQPGPGWGSGWNYPSSSDWPRRGAYGNGTPYPHNAALPGGAWASSSGGGGGGGQPGWSTSPPSAPPMNSAHSWTYGYNHNNQTAPNSPWPGWGQTSANSWGPQTPGGGGGWGAAPPASPYTPWGYPSPYAQPASAPAQPPGSPYDSTSGQPITGGWFGTGGAAANGNGGGGAGAWGGAWGTGGGGGGAWGTGGGGTWPEGTWVQEKKKKKRRNDHNHGHEWPYVSEGEEGEYRLGRSSSIRRSHSNAASPRRSKSLQRSASWGNGNEAYGGWYSTPPQYAQNDLFDEHNLARRPRDWRPDYSAKGGLGAYISLVAKNRSNVKEWNDQVRRHLHPLLSYDPANPPIYYDLRVEPFEPREVEFLNLPGRREANQIDFAQLALQPTCALMRIYHPKLPWYIDVQQSHPNGVTVFDIVSQMHAQLHTSIHPRHFWNEELGEGERAVLTKAFQERVRGDARLVQRGILQVDFLGEKCVFEGLVRGPKGLWELKLGREQP